MQAPGCEQQAGKAVWSTMHSSPRHSRPLAYKSVNHYDHVNNNISTDDVGNHKSGSAENNYDDDKEGENGVVGDKEEEDGDNNSDNNGVRTVVVTRSWRKRRRRMGLMT